MAPRFASRTLLILCIGCALTAASSGQGQPAWMDAARTPPMGWNSWNKFGCNVSESLIRDVADAMVTSA